MNTASGGDGIPLHLFQILNRMLWKCCTQNASKFGKLSSDHRTGKSQFSFQSQRKASRIQKRQRNQRSNCQHPLDHGKSKGVPEKHLFLLYWLCQSLWLCGSQQTELGILDHLTCLLRNLYAGKEAPLRTRHGTVDWFQIGKGVSQGSILSCCLTYMHAKCQAGWLTAGIKTARRNIKNLR